MFRTTFKVFGVFCLVGVISPVMGGLCLSPVAWAQGDEDAVVKRILFDVRGGRLPEMVRGGVNYLYGRRFSTQMTDRLRDSVLDILRTSGHHKSQVKVEAFADKSGIIMKVMVDLGPLCKIRGVEAEFVLAADLTDPSGKVCSRRALNNYFTELSGFYKKNAYETSFEQAQFRVSDDGKTAQVVVVGELGPKIRYEFEVRGDMNSPDHQISEKKKQWWQKRLAKRIKVVDVNPRSVAQMVQNLMMKDGYMSSISEPHILVIQNIKTYRFVVTASEKIRLRNIEVLGVKVFDHAEINDVFRSRKVLGLRNRLSVRGLSGSIEILRDKYLKQGYLDVRIDRSEWSKDTKSGTYDVIVQVSEGLLHVFDSLRVKGSSFPTDRLLDLSSFEADQPMEGQQTREFQIKLSDFYDDQGYLDKKIRLSFERQLRKNRYHTTVHVKVEEGLRHVIDSISILGLTKTHQQVVRRQLQFDRGDVWSPRLVEESYLQLKKLGLFKSIRFEQKPVVQRKHPDVHAQGFSQHNIKPIAVTVQIEELSHGFITFGPEYNLLSGYQYSIAGSYNNLFGRGHRILARLRVDEDRQQPIIDDQTIFASTLSLRYIYPFVAGLPVQFGLSASRRVSAPTFWQYTSLLREELSYQLPTLRNTRLIMYTKQSLSREVGTSDQRAYFLSNQDSLLFAGGVEVVADRRDDMFRPTKGYMVKVGYEKAFYAYLFNTRYDKWDFNSEWVQTVWDNMALILGLRFTQIRNIDVRGVPVGFNTLPASELLQAGGVGLVRGYHLYLGPYVMYTSLIDSDQVVQDILGGTDRLIINAKWRILLSEQLALNVFFDMGNTYLNQATLDTYELRFSQTSGAFSRPVIYDNYPLIWDDWIQIHQLWRKLYSSAGVAFDYLTPIGNIQLSLAHPLYQPHPQSAEHCASLDTAYCLDRRRAYHPILQRFRVDLSVSARF